MKTILYFIVIFATVITGCESDLIDNFSENEKEPEVIQTDSIKISYEISVPGKDLNNYSENQLKSGSTIIIETLFMNNKRFYETKTVVEKRINLVNGYGSGELWVKTDLTMGDTTYAMPNGYYQSIYCYQYKAEKFNDYLSVEFYFNGITYPSNGSLFFVYDFNKFYSFDL